MYDMPEAAAATDSWWAGLARHFGEAGLSDVPTALTRSGEGTAFWRGADMFFSQTCGYPFVTALSGHVSLLATPCYDAPGCIDADYCSLVVVDANAGWDRLADLSGARCALNSADSWSGHHALRLLLTRENAGGRYFTEVVETGSHAASVTAVADGKADCAAIDCVTYANLSRYRPAAVEGTRVLCRTPAMPGLPLIASKSVSPDAMRRGLAAAMDDPRLAEARSMLGIVGMRFLDEGEYGRLNVALRFVEAAGVEPLL